MPIAASTIVDPTTVALAWLRSNDCEAYHSIIEILPAFEQVTGLRVVYGRCLRRRRGQSRRRSALLGGPHQRRAGVGRVAGLENSYVRRADALMERENAAPAVFDQPNRKL